MCKVIVLVRGAELAIRRHAPDRVQNSHSSRVSPGRAFPQLLFAHHVTRLPTNRLPSLPLMPHYRNPLVTSLWSCSPDRIHWSFHPLKDESCRLSPHLCFYPSQVKQHQSTPSPSTPLHPFHPSRPIDCNLVASQHPLDSFPTFFVTSTHQRKTCKPPLRCRATHRLTDPASSATV